MDVPKVKISDIANSSLNLVETKFSLRSRPRAAMFVVSFAYLKSRALSCEPSGDCVIPRTKVRVRAQASHGNITVAVNAFSKF